MTHPLDQPPELRAYYRDPAVVSAYLRRRTAQPLNGYLHRAQVRFINDVIRKRAPARLLEVAPGPGRLTAELRLDGVGVAIDTSAPMLAMTRSRIGSDSGWSLLQGDAFALPLANASVDLVVTLKLIRHFRRDDRLRLYREIRRVLSPHGAFVLDAQNRNVSLPHRQRKGLERYAIYDELFSREELLAELEGAHFRVTRIAGVLHHFGLQERINRLRRLGLSRVARGLMAAVEAIPGNNPSTWMVLNEIRH